MPKHQKTPTHIFYRLPREMFHAILSHLDVRALATLSQTSKWIYAQVMTQKVDYQIQAIKKVRRKQHPAKKIPYFKPMTSTYAELAVKLNLQTKQEQESWNKDKEAFILLGLIMFGLYSLPAAGMILDSIWPEDIRYLLIGYRAYDVGAATTIACGLYLLKEIFGATAQADKQNKPYRLVQYIKEDSVEVHVNSSPSIFSNIRNGDFVSSRIALTGK